MIIEMIKNFESEDILHMEENKPYLSKCVSESDEYAYYEYYVIERNYNDIFTLYNTNIKVFNIIELSRYPLLQN